MTVYVPLVLESVDILAGLPPGLGYAALTIDGDLQPIVTCTERPMPALELTAPPANTLCLVYGWPPMSFRTVPNPGARFPITTRTRDDWLVMDSRSRRGTGPTGWAIDESARIAWTMHPSDAIQDVQVDETGAIWVGRFDENPGLAVFDARGQLHREYNDFFDCYAMNVVSSAEVWVCDYPDFKLVVIRKGGPVQVLEQAPVRGSSAIAIAGDMVLFAPGYDQAHLTVANHRTGEVIHTRLPFHGDGAVPSLVKVRARGNRMYLLTDRGLAGFELRGEPPYVASLPASPLLSS